LNDGRGSKRSLIFSLELIRATPVNNEKTNFRGKRDPVFITALFFDKDCHSEDLANVGEYVTAF